MSNQSADGSTFVEATLATNNGPITVENFDSAFLAHGAAAVTITLRATGTSGSNIQDSYSRVTATYMEDVVATASTTHIYTPNALQSPQPGSFITVKGAPFNHFTFNAGDVGIIDVGGGNLVATGGGNILGSLANSSAAIETRGGNLIGAGGP